MTSSSSMMVMRVLPGEGMTAPRLALLKSYSSRMVSICLAATGLASGNEARPLSALSMNHHKHSARGIHSKGDEALLTHGIRVLDRVRHRIAKCLLGVREADPVFSQVGLCLGWIKLERHAALCIRNAYAQVTPLERRISGG